VPLVLLVVVLLVVVLLALVLLALVLLELVVEAPVPTLLVAPVPFVLLAAPVPEVPPLPPDPGIMDRSTAAMISQPSTVVASATHDRPMTNKRLSCTIRIIRLPVLLFDRWTASASSHVCSTTGALSAVPGWR
jgi:hypothetical protein